MAYSQANRSMFVTTTLGSDELILRGFRGVESLSAPFSFELDIVSTSPDIPFQDLLHQPVTVSILLPDGETYRNFNGLVRRFEQGAQDAEGLCQYRAEIVPWLWFLRLTSDCRIFQHMSVQEIVSKVFDDLGFSDYEFRGLSAGQEPLEYCVQYRESAFNFVSRLLEEAGIFYFFEHFEDRHLLVLADASVEHPPCPWDSSVRCSRHTGMETRGENIITDLRISREVRTSKIALQDFNFETPSTSLAVNCAEEGVYEVYDYPGRYCVVGAGDAQAKTNLEGHSAGICQIRGSSNSSVFTAGHKFNLKDHYRSDLEADQVLSSVVHEGHQPISITSSGEAPFHYRNTFASFPASATWRPQKKARKPIVTGTQTAIVVGKEGEEIWTDSYGRIKVQFHWDREGKRDENSSCWVRVSQNWAGKQWGTFFLPRMGQEVVVDFLEGDPDRPIVIGSFYNAEQMPPYSLPDNQTQSAIKTLSSKGGEGHNEIRFEDKKGEEQVFIHAERNFDLRVKSNSMSNVGGNYSMTVGGEKDGSTFGDSNSKIFKDRHLLVKGDSRVLVEKKSSLRVKEDAFEDYLGNHKMTVGTEAYVKAPTIILEAEQSISIKGPGGFIKIDSAGITIVGSPQVKINSGGAADETAISGEVDEPEDPTAADSTDPGTPSI